MPDIPIPDDVYWPWRFIPEIVDSYTKVDDSKFQVNWLCKECLVLRHSIVLSRFWFDSKEPRSEDAENSELFEHHVDSHAMIQSAHGGCHLGSLLLATWLKTKIEDFPIVRYKVALLDPSTVKALFAP